MILIYITNPSEEDARKIASSLLEKHLIACGNIFPTTSMYRWKGELKDEREFVLIAKTDDDMFEKVEKEVLRIHSYDCPCIIRMAADANQGFLAWLQGELQA